MYLSWGLQMALSISQILAIAVLTTPHKQHASWMQQTEMVFMKVGVIVSRLALLASLASQGSPITVSNERSFCDLDLVDNRTGLVFSSRLSSLNADQSSDDMISLVCTAGHCQTYWAARRENELHWTFEFHFWAGDSLSSTILAHPTDFHTGILWCYRWTITANTLYVSLRRPTRLVYTEDKADHSRILQHIYERPSWKRWLVKFHGQF